MVLDGTHMLLVLDVLDVLGLRGMRMGMGMCMGLGRRGVMHGSWCGESGGGEQRGCQRGKNFRHDGFPLASGNIPRRNDIRAAGIVWHA